MMAGSPTSSSDTRPPQRSRRRQVRGTTGAIEYDPGASAPIVSIALVLSLTSSLAFGRRCIPAGCVAHRSNIPDMLTLRALPSGRLAALGAQRTCETRHEQAVIRYMAARDGLLRTDWIVRRAVCLGRARGAHGIAARRRRLVDREARRAPPVASGRRFAAAGAAG